MSTRSTIGIINITGEIEYVYCHFDGYPSNNGRLLLENYTTTMEVLSLLKQGDMVSLDTSPEASNFYGGGTKSKTISYLGDMQHEEYTYLWDTAKCCWLWSSSHDEITLQPLTMEDCN